VETAVGNLLAFDNYLDELLDTYLSVAGSLFEEVAGNLFEVACADHKKTVHMAPASLASKAMSRRRHKDCQSFLAQLTNIAA
jgi:hypothetical protein